MRRVIPMLFLAALAGAVMSGSARADGYFGYGFPWFGYGNNGPAAYALGNIPAPPYFALHPPVYYSHPMARPYGHSPFACSCDGHYGARIAPPRVVVNPLVKPRPADKKTATASHNVAAVPLRIVNPFYQAEKAETGLVSYD